MEEGKEIELLFVKETLERYGARLQQILVKSITGRKLVSAGNGPHLKDSLRYEIVKKGSFGYEFRLFFPDYGRFLEIRWWTKKSVYHNMIREKRNNGVKEMFASRKRRDTRWYAKPTYSTLSGLIGELMYGLTDKVQDSLKEQLGRPLE